MSNYFIAPIEASVVGERFKVEGKPLDGAAILALAERLNAATEDLDGAVWLSPGADREVARVHHMPLEIGGRTVQYVFNEETAIFPARRDQA